MSRHRPPEADSRISRFTARLLWAEASLGAPLGRGFLLMQCVTGSAGWRLGGGSRQPSRPIQVFKKSGCPLCRNQHAKIFPCAVLPSLSRATAWSGTFSSTYGKFWFIFC